ncbi:MAG: hypothetical protein AAGD47_02550 [Pseudomonadota bacterium]
MTRISDTLIRLAEEKSKRELRDPNEIDTDQIYKEASRIALGLVEPFRSSLYLGGNDINLIDEDQARYAFRMTSNTPKQGSINRISNEGPLDVDRSDFEDGIFRYLESDFRDPVIDGLLIRSVLDMEITALIARLAPGDQTVDAEANHMLTRNVWLDWIWGRIRALFFTGIAIAVLYGISTAVPQTYAELLRYVCMGLGGLYLVGTVLGLVSTFIDGPATNRVRERKRDQVETAEETFVEFHRSTQISVSRLRHRVYEAAGKGIIWPQVLFALIDDLQTRQVKLV